MQTHMYTHSKCIESHKKKMECISLKTWEVMFFEYYLQLLLIHVWD